jgi:hypothetical protein
MVAGEGFGYSGYSKGTPSLRDPCLHCVVPSHPAECPFPESYSCINAPVEYAEYHRVRQKGTGLSPATSASGPGSLAPTSAPGLLFSLQ